MRIQILHKFLEIIAYFKIGHHLANFAQLLTLLLKFLSLRPHIIFYTIYFQLIVIRFS